LGSHLTAAFLDDSPLCPSPRYSFLDNSRIKASDRNDSVRLVVRGAPAEQPDHTGRAPAPTRRSVELAPGDDYGKAAEEIRARGWEGAFVVHVSVAQRPDG
jgi:hypothetical protein